jgi:hypothetical protein
MELNIWTQVSSIPKFNSIIADALLITASSLLTGKPGSSVSIVCGYGLDDRAIEVRSPAEAKIFFL